MKPSLFSLLLPLAALLALPLTAGAVDINVDLTHLGGPLKKPGLGSLFGISTLAGGTPRNLIAGSVLNLTSSQGKIGPDGALLPNAYSTNAIAPLVRGTGARLMCRFNDVCPGFPYDWIGYNEWMRQITAATHAVDGYKDVVYAIEVLNEPDNKLNNLKFMSDPLVQGNTYDDRINWLWTQSVRAIRAIDPSLKVMGPNYETYTNPAAYARMEKFMRNAVETGTSPDVIGWHSLGIAPGDAPNSLVRYRRLEKELAVPHAPLPVSIDEYGPDVHNFEGVPGTMVPFWAAYERAGIDFACTGIYANFGILANGLRPVWNSNPQPNGGWYAMHWYREMQGRYAPVRVSADAPALDGVASWDAAAKTATVVLGGTTGNADVHMNGIGSMGLGLRVRVRLDAVLWPLNSADGVVEHSGDPQDGPLALYDKIVPVAPDGTVTVPVHGMARYDAYRVVVSPAASPTVVPNKYEAEDATLAHATVHKNEGAGTLASGDAYVGGIDTPESAVTFHVNVPVRGLYQLTARYAANGTLYTNVVFPPALALSVNGDSQGEMNFPATQGWSDTQMLLATRLVALGKGDNALRFTKERGFVEMDFIDVRPDTHRYEAEYAASHAVTAHSFAHVFNVPNYVGGIDSPESYVEFAIDAPRPGPYALRIAYGATDRATHRLSVNGIAQPDVVYPATGGYLGAPDPRPVEKTLDVPVTLTGGTNLVRLSKGDGFAELDYVTLQPASGN